MRTGFDAFDLDPKLLRGVADLGFSTPTPIQQKAIPPGIEGRDLLACAMTGSGKTAAFLLPILESLMDAPKGATRALVLAPTRELAAQIVEQFEGLAQHTHLRAAAVYGGVGMSPQEKAFRQGVDVIVACPGRLLDHFNHDYARLDDLEVLVLDEADRMLDMGFLPDIRRVLKHLPTPDQTLLFSATMPREIVALSKDLLRDPVALDVERPSAPATGVKQTLFEIRQDLKSRLLHHLLEGDEIGNVLVFTRTKHRANRLCQYLVKRGVSADRIHGNRTQGQRTKALAGFKNGDIRVLVATDIAARGIDVEALSHVVNFDVPHMPEDYIHRVGRTARARATGEAFTFVAPQEIQELRGIERALGKRLPRRKVEGFDREAPAEEALEIPLNERIAAHRARRRDERARSQAKAERSVAPNGGGRRRGGRVENEGANESGGRRSRGRAGASSTPRNRPDANRRGAQEASAEGTGQPKRRRRRRRSGNSAESGNRAQGAQSANSAESRGSQKRSQDGRSQNSRSKSTRSQDGRGASSKRRSSDSRSSNSAGSKSSGSSKRRRGGNRRHEDVLDAPRPRPRNSLYY